MNLERKVAQSLREGQKTLSIAESCTGGLLSHRITNIPGSSQFFKGSVVVYSNQAKINFLKIHAPTITLHGAVSAPIARQMAQNVYKLFRADFGIGITGIAGPTGATKTKPLGLTYIAVCSKSKTLWIKKLFKGTRFSIKSQAATQALKMLLKIMK